MSSKIRVKIGSIEVEFEGSEEFMQDKLLEFVGELSNLITYQNPNFILEDPVNNINSNQVIEENSISKKNNINGTTNTIAAKLKVDSGPDLVIAAAAHFHFVQDKNTFSRKELLQECRSASSFFKQSYVGNFSAMLTRLVKNSTLAEQSKDVYALTANQIKNLEQKFGQ